MPLYNRLQSLGLVTSHVPPTTHRQGLSTFITSPVKPHTLHLYDTNLHLKGVSKPFPSSWPDAPISHVAANDELTFVVLGSQIGVYNRLTPCALWSPFPSSASISLLTVSAGVLISVAGQLLVSHILPARNNPPSPDGVVHCELLLPPDFHTITVTHPPTWLNKILLAAEDGRCAIVNLRSRTIVHTFNAFPARITSLVPSPVVDVVAVGMVDGRISLHNFRVDETITTFHHNVNTPSNDPSPLLANGVVSITFRTDGVENMLTADSLGNICVWDLPSRSLVSSLRGVHNEIHFALFLPSEPVFITAGVDNALKIHLFDHGSSEPRLLRARQGHHLPPTLIRFAGEDGLHMVSAGLDHELRLVSAVHDARNRPFRPPTQLSAPQRKRLRIQENKEVGERAVSNRLPLVHALACNTARNRDGDFANVVTLHEGLQQAYTWRLQDGASHHHVLTPPPHPEMFELTFKKSKSVGKKRKKEKVVNVDSTATSVVLTPCGNYAIVGSQDGRIHSYNLQSGRHKGVYQLENSLTENSWGYAHHGPVVALSVDSCGDTLVSAGAEDCTLKFWNLHDRHESGDCIVTSSNIRNLSWCSTSDLIVIACQDFCLYVYDGSTRKLARHFKGHCGPIVDVCFDHQGRRVLSTSMDSTVRTWDLPSGRLVDTMACADAPTSISVAPGGDYIATTHVNDLGVNLWVDRSKFLPLSSVSIEYSSSAVSEGSVVVDDAPLDEEVKKCTENVVDVADDEFGRPKPLSRDVVTLSCHPTSHWTVLSDLQAIKERNKPKEPVEKPQSAPFFLPTVKGLKMEFDTSGILREASGKKSAKACSDKEGKENGDVNEEDWANSRFGKLVAREEYDSAAQLLRNLEPSGVDLEIRTLEGQMTRRKACVFFEKMLQCPQDFELTQAHLSVFLKSQGIALAKDDEGSRLLNALLESQAAAWESLRSNFESVVSLSGYFSGQV